MAALAKAPRTTYEGNTNVSFIFYSTFIYFSNESLMDQAFFPLDIEKQIQQLQAQRSNLPKVDVGEKVSVNDLALQHTFPSCLSPKNTYLSFSIVTGN